MKAAIFVDDTQEGDLLKTMLGYTGLEVIVSLNLEPVLENWPQDSAEVVILAVDDQATAFSYCGRCGDGEVIVHFIKNRR
jgi:hypothetical protein